MKKEVCDTVVDEREKKEAIAVSKLLVFLFFLFSFLSIWFPLYTWDMRTIVSGRGVAPFPFRRC